MEQYLTNFKGYSTTLAQAGKSSTSNSSQKTSIQKNKEYDIKKGSRKFVLTLGKMSFHGQLN